MRIVIIGASEIGAGLARRLSSRHSVLLVDKRPETLAAFGPGREPVPSSLQGLVAAGLTSILGDGTSRLVLKGLYDAGQECALVALTGEDASNLEIGRLGREVGYDPILAIQNSGATSAQYLAGRIQVIPKVALLVDQLERSLGFSGAVVPIGVGLGRGELLEIRLQSTSPILKQPLKDLDPHRWRVAAIFREESLVVPDGNSTLEADDRVLLVGDPEVLPAVSEYLRLGTPEFPRPYGPNVVSLELGHPDEALAREATYAACSCAAAQIVRGYPGAPDSSPAQGEELLLAPVCKGTTKEQAFNLTATVASESVPQVLRYHPGVVFVRPPQLGFRQRLRIGLGRKCWDAELCDQLRVPVLFGRGTFPYARILMSVSGSSPDLACAELAIDVTRQLGATLTALHVTLPTHLTGDSAQLEAKSLLQIQQLGHLFNMSLTTVEREGNPVREVLNEARGHNLVVMARNQHRPDNAWTPDVALRVARAAPCSVLVLTLPSPEKQ